MHLFSFNIINALKLHIIFQNSFARLKKKKKKNVKRTLI